MFCASWFTNKRDSLSRWQETACVVCGIIFSGEFFKPELVYSVTTDKGDKKEFCCKTCLDKYENNPENKFESLARRSCGK